MSVISLSSKRSEKIFISRPCVLSDYEFIQLKGLDSMRTRDMVFSYFVSVEIEAIISIEQLHWTNNNSNGIVTLHMISE